MKLSGAGGVSKRSWIIEHVLGCSSIQDLQRRLRRPAAPPDKTEMSGGEMRMAGAGRVSLFNTALAGGGPSVPRDGTGAAAPRDGAGAAAPRATGRHGAWVAKTVTCPGHLPHPRRRPVVPRPVVPPSRVPSSRRPACRRPAVPSSRRPVVPPSGRRPPSRRARAVPAGPAPCLPGPRRACRGRAHRLAVSAGCRAEVGPFFTLHFLHISIFSALQSHKFHYVHLRRISSIL